MKRRALPFIVVAALAPLLMAPIKAPGFILRFDNKPDGGAITNTGTPDFITVSVAFNDGDVRTFSGVSMSGVAEDHDVVVVNRYFSDVQWIMLWTNGDNWLWIDQVQALSPGTFVELRHWGIDNTVGWCVSTDTGDGTNAVCDPDGSSPSRFWYP